jgi:hypothetical protein
MKGFYMHGQQPSGCYLCGQPVVIVGVFVPDDDEKRNAVLALRTAPLDPDRAVGLAYGVCEEHARDMSTTTEAVEAKLLAEARAVTRH